MGERKVLNKYYPPDFDPATLPRTTRTKGPVVVRFMLPCSVQCSGCGEYIYRGKKFNARKEEVMGGDYLGIRVWRFYFKCVNCVNEITIVTDPKNADYVCESGASRNFEPWRQANEANESLRKEREEEEKLDQMLALEHRTTSNKREMEELDKLEEIQELNQLRKDVDPVALIEARRRRLEEANSALPDDDEFDIPAEKFVRRLATEPLNGDEYDDQPASSSNASSSRANGTALPDMPFTPAVRTVAAKDKVAPGLTIISAPSSSSSSSSTSTSSSTTTQSRFGADTAISLSTSLFGGAQRAPIVAKRKSDVNKEKQEKKRAREESKPKEQATTTTASTTPAQPSAGLSLLAQYGGDDSD